jgi:Big-like domain-containing protein/Regulator of Chromosome Condensation (RCC1) repeat protein/regulator of chromosome condensation (RCC1) repeat-containing protein
VIQGRFVCGCLVLAWLAACSDSGPCPACPQPAASITITPSSATLAAYATTELVATMRDAAGRVVSNPSFEWTSDAPAVATVDAATVDGGRVTGLVPGNATITAKQGTVQGTALVTVTASPVTVTVGPDTATIVVSGYAVLFDTLRRSDGQVVSGFPVTWTSENPAVATIDTNGLVKGISSGSTRVVARRDASSDTAVIVVTTINLASLSAGGPTCGVTVTGAAYCWGSNLAAQLGLGLWPGPQEGRTCSLDVDGYFCSTVPALVAGGLEFSSVSVGGGTACGLTVGGAAYCWGAINIDDYPPITVPGAVAGGHTFASLSASRDHACAITTSGVAFCWGNNSHGQLGNGSTASSLVPVAVSGGLTFSSVSVGGRFGPFTCGLTTSGAAHCWGGNEAGQLGDGSTTESHVPVAVTGGLTFTALSVAAHACGTIATGAAYCWGENYGGQLGDSSTADRHIPVAVAGGLTFASISAGWGHTCGLTTSGTAYCWGDNRWGELGDGSTIDGRAPVAVSGALTWAALSAGDVCTCGLTTAGVAYCWGGNEGGRLGNGTITNRTIPVKVAGQP